MYPFFKRLFDFLFALTGIIILLPVFVPVIILLLLTGEHEVFYFQQRIGYKNRVFRIFKFATMLKNSASIGTGEITLRNDPRVTPMGTFLRRTKLNELPQLFNVLSGDMSLVGARPLMQKSFDLYPQSVKNLVYRSRPGITGIGSVVFRDEEKIISESTDIQAAYRDIFEYKGRLEQWYQQHFSFYTDFMLLFLTGWYIIFSESELVYKVFRDLPRRRDQVVAARV